MDELKPTKMESYWCQKNARRLDLPCCPEPDKTCKHRSDCMTYFEMEENGGKGCPEREKGGKHHTSRA